jgi:predicted dehydrogenase
MGWRYDANTTGVLTHSKAIYEHPQLQLVAAVDPNPQACNEFKQAYPRVETFANLHAAAAKHRLDWIILALPTHLHFSAFFEALSFNPKVIVCEKPLAPSVAEASEMLRCAKEQGVLVFVNYIRPHEPACKAMFAFVREATWGPVEKILVRYGKGISNNASHFIQLLIQAFGAPDKVQLLDANHLPCADPEPDFILHFGSMQAVFLRFDYQLYALSEMDIYLQQGAIFYRAMGQLIEYQQAQADALFPSVKRLRPLRSDDTQLSYYQRHALAYYYAVWQNRGEDEALTQSALQALQVIEQVQVQISALGAP